MNNPNENITNYIKSLIPPRYKQYGDCKRALKFENTVTSETELPSKAELENLSVSFVNSTFNDGVDILASESGEDSNVLRDRVKKCIKTGIEYWDCKQSYTKSQKILSRGMLLKDDLLELESAVKTFDNAPLGAELMRSVEGDNYDSVCAQASQACCVELNGSKLFLSQYEILEDLCAAHDSNPEDLFKDGASLSIENKCLRKVYLPSLANESEDSVSNSAGSVMVQKSSPAEILQRIDAGVTTLFGSLAKVGLAYFAGQIIGDESQQYVGQVASTAVEVGLPILAVVTSVPTAYKMLKKK